MKFGLPTALLALALTPFAAQAAALAAPAPEVAESDVRLEHDDYLGSVEAEARENDLPEDVDQIKIDRGDDYNFLSDMHDHDVVDPAAAQ